MREILVERPMKLMKAPWPKLLWCVTEGMHDEQVVMVGYRGYVTSSDERNITCFGSEQSTDPCGGDTTLSPYFPDYSAVLCS